MKQRIFNRQGEAVTQVESQLAGEGEPNTAKSPKKAGSSGTMEWAARTVNCVTGCAHNCRYCYARGMAALYGRVKPEEWKNQKVRWKDVRKAYRLFNGTVMFPSSHDITPATLLPCMIVLDKLLKAGNRVLVVSKPHLECIEAICRAFGVYRAQILFRFTMGTMDNGILSYWEPNAPSYEERRDALRSAFERGYETSVSVEPMLDSVHIENLVNDLMPYATNAIWIGTMNHQRDIQVEDEICKAALQKVREGQSRDRILAIYETLKGNAKIKWKSHIKKIVGIPQAEEPGLDM